MRIHEIIFCANLLSVKLQQMLLGGLLLGTCSVQAAEESPAAMLVRQAGFYIGFYYNGPTTIDNNFRTFTAQYQTKLNDICQQDIKCSFEKAVPIIKEMAANLNDPFTAYFEADQMADFERLINGAGPAKPWLGLLTKQINDGLIVLEAYPGEPAAQIGIKRGDKITKINNQPASMDLLNQVGSLKLEINGKTIDINTKNALGTPQPTGQLINDIYVIRIPNFWSVETVGNKVHRLVVEAKVNRAKGIIIDLRDSDTGYDGEAIAAANAFIPKYEFAYKERFIDREQVWTVENGNAFSQYKNQSKIPQFEVQNPQITDLPTVVLVNKDTVNSAEMMAYFLQSNKRATVIGEKTAGQLSTSGQSYELIDGGSIQVSNLRLYDAKGQVFPLYVTPNIEIADDLTKLAAGQDVILQKAMEILNQGGQK